MTADLSQLLRAVCIDPFDDLAKYAYADCLEELGEVAQSQLIRESLKLAALPGQPGVSECHGSCSSSCAYCQQCTVAHDAFDLAVCGVRYSSRRHRHYGFKKRAVKFSRQCGVPKTRAVFWDVDPNGRWWSNADDYALDEKRVCLLFWRGFPAVVYLPPSRVDVLPELVSQFPLTEARIAGAWPGKIRTNQGTGYIWSENRRGSWEDWDEDSDLHPAVWQEIQTTAECQINGVSIPGSYTDEDAAIEHLSQTLLDSARKMTGLPPLPRKAG